MNAGTGKFTAPLDGHYFFTFQGFEINIPNTLAYIYLNGKIVSTSYFHFGHNNPVRKQVFLFKINSNLPMI